MAKKIIAIVLCLLFVMAVLASCAATSPKAVVKKLEKAYNKKSGKAYFEILDPTSQVMVKSAAKKEGESVDKYLKDQMFDEDNDKKVTVKIKKVNYGEGKTTAEVKCEIKFKGEDETLEETISCVKVGGKWYYRGGF